MRKRNKPPKKGLGLENQGYTKWYINEKLKQHILQEEVFEDEINDIYIGRNRSKQKKF